VGRVKVVEVINRHHGTVKIKFGKMGAINTTLPPECLNELKKKRQILKPGIWVDHPGFQFGPSGDKPTHRRKKRKHHDRVVPTNTERVKRKWRKRIVKITIEWKLKGGIHTAAREDDGKERRLTPEQMSDLEDNITRFVAIPGMEEAVKQMTEALKKARDPGSGGGVKEDKKNFVPLMSYSEIRKNIRELAEDEESPLDKISLTRIEECSYDKLVFHLFSEGIKTFEEKKTGSNVPWGSVEDFIVAIHDIEVVDYFTSVKQEDSK
jgi:hypothetical protein